MVESTEEALVEGLRAVLDDRRGSERPGLFITFEGGDGSGKTTQVAKLYELLSGSGVPTVSTREPGGTPLGQELRRHVMHGPEDVDPRTEALLYAADRAYHVSTLIRPALAEGKVVLGDRYIDSSVAYQGAARDLGTEEVRALSDWATAGLKPDLTVLFDLDPETGIARTGNNLDRLERAGSQFRKQVRQQYLRMIAAEPKRFVVVNAAGSVEGVFAELISALSTALRSDRIGTHQ